MTQAEPTGVAPRTVVITGASGALGTAVTERFTEDGYNVVTASLGGSDTMPEGAGRSIFSVGADVTDPASVERLVETTLARFRTIDGLVHLLGGWVGGMRLEDHPVEKWDGALEINLRSAFLCSRAVIPVMRAQASGRIVFVSSRSARFDRSLEGPYAIAKAGVGILAEVIAEENRDVDVTANAVAPSALDTPTNRAARSDPLVPIPDVARTIAFLASPAAGQLRGAWLPVFGRA
jgi:NAD(P)-dependent dehydrogenase (short-subunit alcohol dehydrogenase family)